MSPLGKYSGDFKNLPRNGICHCYCGGGKLHDTIALSELALTYLHGFALGELATTLNRDKN